MPEFTPVSHPGRLHAYGPGPLRAFEHTPNPSKPSPKDVLLLIHGFTDGILSSSFFAHLASALPAYSVVEVGISSSYMGCATSSVQKDAEEILACIKYFRQLRPKDAKFVVLGHSTGCQDVVHLFTRLSEAEIKEAVELVDAAVLLAPVSDHDWIRNVTPAADLEKSVKEAEKMVQAGDGWKMMYHLPTAGFHEHPIMAKRWLSLAASLSRYPAGEDYFGEFLNEEQKESVWGAMGRSGLKKLLLLLPGEDEYYFSKTSIEKASSDWARIARRAGLDVDIKIVPSADHAFKKKGMAENGAEELEDFLDTL